MKPIYLASNSKARKKLFTIFGRKFKVIPSGIEELQWDGAMPFSALVKKNALLKAKASALKVRSGIIVSADTLVTDGKSVFGKPKDLREAKKMLKHLSGSSQWVYTGLVVIDLDSGRMRQSSEKTRIYMDPLTDKEIDTYFRFVSPLNKAGSFDVQDKGAFFISRIEGCFYNVVGLPLRKLYRMFRSLGLKFFSLAVCCSCVLPLLLCGGCSTEYNVVTGQEEQYFYSTDKEIKIGEAMSRQIEKRYKFDPDPLVQKRVQDIGKKIADVCDRKDITYTFRVIKDKEINAVSLPGGWVYINSGLVEKVNNDDELAGVIAHEVGHIVARHSIKKLQAVMGYQLLRFASIAVSPGEVGATADVAMSELLLGYGREDELLADQLSARYLKRAGYNPRGTIMFLEHLEKIERRKPLKPKNYFKTHPYAPDRIRVIKQELGEKIDFDDYINTEQKTHNENKAPFL